MREFLTLDYSRFPIVIGKYHPFIPTQEEFVKSQSIIEDFCAAHEDFALILDFSEIPILSSEYRISSAKWASKNDALFVRQKMRVVFFTPSIITQIVMKGVFLLSRPSIPHTMTTRLDKAIAWAQKQLSVERSGKTV